MKTTRPSLLGAILVALCAAVSPVTAEWAQNADPGPYNYTNTANWVGGVIDNVFSSTPADGLNITFSTNWTLDTYMTISWPGTVNVTFRSDSATARTIKLTSDFMLKSVATGGSITIGTVANPLIIDLNGNTRHIGGALTTTGSGSSTNDIYAKIIDSSGAPHGVTLGRCTTYGYLRNNANSFAGPVTFLGARGGGFTSIKNKKAGTSALGSPTDDATGLITIIDQKSFGELTYLGSGDTSDRPFLWTLTGNNYSFANRGTGKLTLTGPWTLSPMNMIINAASNHIQLDGYLKGASSSTTNVLRIQGGSASSTNQVVLTCLTNDFPSLQLDSGVLAYKSSIPAAGVPSPLGIGPVVLNGGALQYTGATPATNSHSLLLTNSGPYKIESTGSGSAPLTLACDFVSGATYSWVRAINLNVGTFSTIDVQAPIPDLDAADPISIVVGLASGAALNNGGTVKLSNPNNSFTAGVQIKYGRTLQAPTLASLGLPCSIGLGTAPQGGLTAIAFGSIDSGRGGILAYTGTTDATCDRPITIVGSASVNNSSGTILNNSPNNSSLVLADSYSSPVTYIASGSGYLNNGYLNLGGSAVATNIFGFAIPNTPLGYANLTVFGSIWVLTNAYHGYYGTTTVTNGGTLLIQSPGIIPFGQGVVVTNNGVLGGNGAIYEDVTVQATGTLSPGFGSNDTQTSTLTISGNLTCQGTVAMKLDKGNNGSDQIMLTDPSKTLTYGGTLVLRNLSGTLAAGDSFQLFQATNYAGSFSSISPGTPGSDLAWDLSRLNTGVLGVADSRPRVRPQITSFQVVPGGTMEISGSGTSADANRTYYLLMSTNVTPPMIWTPIETNVFDMNGDFSLVTALDPSEAPQKFFRIQVP